MYTTGMLLYTCSIQMLLKGVKKKKKILVLGVIVIIAVTGCGYNSNSNFNAGGCNTVVCSEAEIYAKSDIPEIAGVWTTLRSNEIKCNATEVTNDEIILVKCTTTNDELIDYYNSSTIWFGYLAAADGNSYFRWENASRDKVLAALRQ